MNTARAPMYPWNTLGWTKIERQVFKRQQRLSRAAARKDHRHVRRRQNLLRRSRAAKRLAVRNVTQDNQGKKTPGVEGVANLTSPERLERVKPLHLQDNASPVRRVSMPKPGTTEQRPVGIPTLAERAKHSWVTQALAPAWEAQCEPTGEAQCEPNSDGVRPGRSPWDAMGAIDVQSNQQPKWVLEADIATGVARSNHEAVLRQRDAPPTVRRQMHAWLKAGLRDQGSWLPTEAGTPPGGPLSPLRAHVARHGLEEASTRAFPGRGTPALLRDAEDRVVLHPPRAVIERCQALLADQLRGMGLEVKPSKTRITHPLRADEGEAGFDCLGFHIRQYPTQSKRGYKTILQPSREARARHQRQMVAGVRRHRMAPPARLLEARTPVLRGWRHDCSTVCRHEAYEPLDEQLRQPLRSWIRVRHPQKRRKWGAQQYWRGTNGRRHFMPRARGKRWRFHTETPLQRHSNVQGRRSPYDGDTVSWGRRRAHHPGVSQRVARLLSRHAGRCTQGGYVFNAGDVREVDHLIPRNQGGRDDSTNWQWLQRYCHVPKTARDRRRCA